MKKTLKALLLFLIISLILTSCTVNLKRNISEEDAVYEDKYDVIDKGPVKGGSIRLFSTPVDTMNPLLTNNTYVQDFLGLVFEGLYTLDYSQQPIPVLAKSSSISADGLTLTIFLRENIKWHDKMPFKPEDVVFTINTLMDKNNVSVYSKNVQHIESATANGNAVILKLKQPYSFIKYELTFPIIPAHHFLNEKLNDKKSKANMTPVGTGPYSLNTYNEKSGIKLKLNGDWWNADGAVHMEENPVIENFNEPINNDTGKNTLRYPYLSTIEVKIINTAGGSNKAFQARDIDVLPAEYSEFRKYIGRTDINLKRFAGKNFEFLTLNLKKGPLADKRLRNALNYLIDKKQLIDTSASGIAVPAEIPVTPNSWVYKLIDFEQKNSEGKAKDLLKQSGYVLDSKNKYVKRGSALSLKLIVNDGNSLRNNTANVIASQLGKRGVTVQVSTLPWDSYLKALKSGAYDMALSGYRVSSVPDLSFAYSTDDIQTGLNVAGYSNTEVDGYLNQILTEYNSDTQKNLYLNLLNAVMDDRPYIGLYFINDAMMYSKNIKGAVNPYIWNKYYDITKWYLP